MECPFCAERIKDEAIVCKHCTRDLRVVRPVIAEIQTTLVELERLQQELDDINIRLALVSNPLRSLSIYGGQYILFPTVVLLAAHYVLLFRFDTTPLYLRIFSVVIPFLFGLVLFVVHKIGFIRAFGFGAATALISVFSMLAIVGYADDVPIMPQSTRDWREAIEYGLSISLAYAAGNALGVAVFRLIPTKIAAAGSPGSVALQLARLLGRHDSDESVRRRARLVQEIWKDTLSIVTLLTSLGASLYAGLKGVLGN